MSSSNEEKASKNIIIIRNQNDFGTKLLSLQENQKACDVELVMNEKRIAVHSIVLAASSEFFEEVFMESDLKEVTLKDIDTDSLNMLIKYCYTGYLETTEMKAKELIKMARVLSISSFLENFGEITKNSLDNNNCISYWKIAKSENIKNLETVAMEFIKSKLVEISVLQDFLNLEYSDIRELFSSQINLSGMDVYHSLKQWLNHDKESRLSFSEDLLNFVSLENIPLEDLINDATAMCNQSSKCLTRYFDAVKSRSVSNPNLLNKDDYTLLAIDNIKSNSHNAELFDKKNNRWILYDGIKFVNNMLAVLNVDEKLMAISDLDTNNSVEFHDLKTNQIDKVASLNHKRNYSATVIFNRNVYILGGLDANQKSVSYVEKWDPISKSWSDVAPLIVPCYGCGAAVLNGKIYVVGGCVTNNSHLNITQVYDPTNNQWDFCQSMEFHRSFAGVGSFGKYLYVIGGETNNYYNYKSIEQFDPTINKWTSVSYSYDIFRNRRYSPGATSYMENFIVAGGKAEDGLGNYVNISSVYIHKNGLYNDWTTMPSLNIERSNFNLINIPWKLAQFLLSEKTKTDSMLENDK